MVKFTLCKILMKPLRSDRGTSVLVGIGWPDVTGVLSIQKNLLETNQNKL